MGLRIQQEVLRQPDALRGWDWAVWLEGERDDIAAVASVVYHLHPSYHDPVRVVRTRRNKFRVCDSTLIEFMILARVIGQNAEEIELRHWLTLSDDDAHISGAPPLIGKPQAILSYSLADAATALRLADALRHQDVEVKSPGQLSSGEPWLRTLSEQVGRAAVVMLVSDKISPWAESEAETFLPRGGKVVPVMLPGREHAPLPPPLHDVQAISLTSDDAIDAVARQIKEAITTADPPASFQTEALAQAG